MQVILTDKWAITEKDTIYRFYSPETAGAAKPGQFVEIKVGEAAEHFLRRPISIFDADDQYFDLLVRTVGSGTKIMTKWQTGQTADVLGPLGNGFTWDPSDDSFLLVAGDMGVAPLNFVAERLIAEGKNVRMLFSPLREKALLDGFIKPLDIETGFSSNRFEVPLLLKKMLSESPADRVFACGPVPFLQIVSDICNVLNVPAQISMESYMACGTGICLGCVVPVRGVNGTEYKKVCSNGPVFDGGEVIFDE